MSIIIKPLITEKVSAEIEDVNRYTFIVDHKANKIEIKHEIESYYGVSVKRVNTMVYGPKVKSVFRNKKMNQGKTNRYKKAIIDLAEGDRIDVYSNL